MLLRKKKIIGALKLPSHATGQTLAHPSAFPSPETQGACQGKEDREERHSISAEGREAEEVDSNRNNRLISNGNGIEILRTEQIYRDYAANKLKIKEN
jgi:hypothetical protein